MKIKRIISALLAGMVFLSGLSVPTAKAAPDQKNETVSWPTGPSAGSLSCDSAILMEVSTGTILYKKNIHKQHYPASITKIMTALLALENSSLSETVTFSEEAVYGIEAGSSTVYSEVGEKMSMEQCLYAIMLESANEVCLGIGEHVAGTSKNFVKMMNEKVKELGLENTHFNNPNGLPDPKHYTTAYDMAVIAREAIQNSTFRKITGTRSYVCEKTNKHRVERYWLNHHQMINGYKYPQYEYKYIIGGKTGYTDISRSTLVTYAEKDGMQLVCVIMKADGPTAGEPNEYTDSTTLLNFGFEKYKKYSPSEKNVDINKDLFNQYGSFFNTEESPVHLSSESSVVLPKGVKLSAAKQKITYNKKVELTDGENVIGQVTYTYGGRKVGSTDIIYDTTKVTHLDEASREMVTKEIEAIKTANEKAAGKKKFFSNIKIKLTNFFSKAKKSTAGYVSTILIIVGIIFVFCTIASALLKNHSRKAGRIRHGSGGYRSKAGRRQHLRRERERRRNNNSKRHRRNHSKHYTKKMGTPFSQDSSKRKRGVTYHKRHKHTKESFGKNFFDFH